MAERKVLFVYRLIAVLFGSLSCGTAFFKVGDEGNHSFLIFPKMSNFSFCTLGHGQH